MRSTAASQPANDRTAAAAGVAATAALAAVVYTIVIGGTGLGELEGLLQIVNAILAGSFILIYCRRAPAQADRIDRLILLALLFFLAAALLSAFPRQSFDAALGALTATSALFVLRGLLARPAVRASFVRFLVGTSIFVTFVTAAMWLPATIQWWALTGGTVLPPLDLNFSASPWGHRHDLALLVVLLYPSHLIGPLSPIRRAVAGLFGVLALLIVVVDGSRNLWLAILVATAAVAAPEVQRRLRSSARLRHAVLIGALGVLVLAVVTGASAVLADRFTNLQTLGARSGMWAYLVQAWSDRPLTGYGPGSFPWILQTTAYYQTNSWAPRHPDSAFFQLLAEGGALGLIAGVMVLAALALPVLRGRSTAAKWALITFFIASVGANPTDFPFLVATAVAWTAFAVPRDAPPQGARSASRLGTVGLFVCLGVIALAFAATTTAGLFYGRASDAAGMGHLRQARDDLKVAVTLDPGMALYVRQRGTLDYLDQAAGLGIADLERATRLNPSDDLAWRTLALAYASNGQADEAAAAIRQALTAQRSDAANLLLAARQQTRDHDVGTATETLAEVVQSWPAIVAAPGWRDLLPAGVMTADVVDGAIGRWTSHRPSPEPFARQALILAALSAGISLDDAAIRASDVSRELARATLSVLRCSPSAPEALAQLGDTERRLPLYWQLVIGGAALTGSVDEAAVSILQIMIGHQVVPEAADDVLNPLNETGLSNDVWGYRRRPITWHTNLDPLPSTVAGDVRLLFFPVAVWHAELPQQSGPGCG